MSGSPYPPFLAAHNEISRRIAIIGGGLGGLMTAFRLQRDCAVDARVSIYEAGERLGGKVLTQTFSRAPVRYEAGAAELYDYSHIGPDPLRELVDELGLHAQPMNGKGVIMDGNLLRDFDNVAHFYGEKTYRALQDFDARARRSMSPEDYYHDNWDGETEEEAEHSFYDELMHVRDADARRYLHTLVHSDLATEPHRTSASYGLQNYLMNYPGYMRLYTIDGGIENLPHELARRVDAEVRMGEPVVRVEPLAGGLLKVTSKRDGALMSETYDFVVVALPHGYLSAIEWRGDALGSAIHSHVMHHDYPAHYLRISVLFQRPFWEQYCSDSYLMLDAFGGCCLYDESSRNGCGPFGVLGWLLGGDQAMMAANLPDERLIEMALDTLPAALRHGRDLFLEGRVHRWIGCVSGLPGGATALPVELRHRPCPEYPNLLTVGDYLFDSTLNGVLDSAIYVAETLTEELTAEVGAGNLMAPAKK